MLDKKVARLTADIALMASAAGLPKQAFGIYQGLEYIDVDNPVSAIGVALEFMNRTKNQEAIDILMKYLDKHPNKEEVKLFLGMALMLEGRNKESEDLLNKLVASNDTKVMTMATEILKEMHKNI